MVGFRDFDGVGIAPVSNKMAVKWRILSPTSSEQSGKKKFLIFPTRLEVHLEDMF